MLSISFFKERKNINEVLKKIEETSCEYIHVDIADNILVPNRSLNDNLLIKELKKIKKPKDVHLMVKDVRKYIDLYKQINPEFITIHIEADNIKDNINYIKSLGIKAGIAVDLDTNIEMIKEYLNNVDLILIMSVKAGFGGQEYNNINYKIEYLKDKYNGLIEVDGGINDTNIKKINSDIKVVGSFVTNSDNYENQIKKLI